MRRTSRLHALTAALALSLFVAYLGLRGIQTRSWGLMPFAAFDLLLIGLIVAEYRRIRPLPALSH
jgi:uncharacterized membrane protein